MATRIPPPSTQARWLLVVAAVLAASSDPAWAQGQKQVLVVYSTRRDAQISIVGEREIPRILEKGLNASVDYYSEFIDRGRSPDAAYQSTFRDFLRLKYQDHAFDVIIAVDNAALEFVAANRPALFAGTPLVFYTSTPAPRVPNSTGVTTQLNLADTLTLAAQLQPDARNMFVVLGRNEIDYEGILRRQLSAVTSPFTVTYLTGLPTPELEARLARLPPHSAIYYMSVVGDPTGDLFHPLEYLDRIAPIANAPIYCWVDSAMDHGIVGGSLKSQTAETEAVAQLALRVLKGEPADGIPTTSPNLNVVQVDWRQLQRWGISESRVPPGTLIRFREPSAWDRYRGFIVGAALFMLAQTLLIAGLLVNRSRRRQAEDLVKAGQAELRSSYERIRDLGGRLLNAQESERSRIARELHDDISQQVALLAIDLELAGGPGEALHRVHDIARSLRDLSHRLHPAKLRLIGLVAALRALSAEMSNGKIAVSFTPSNVPSPLPLEVTVCLYRVVQEALQNALKYSHAAHVSVHLSGMADGLALTIEDDGVGFDVNAAWDRGLGLISMRERLEAIGGTFEVHSTPDAGTTIAVRMPASAQRSQEPSAAM